MKKLTLFFLAAIAFSSCNNAGTDTKEANKDSTAPAPPTPVAVNYPYTIDHPDNWDMGSKENTLVALNALKTFFIGRYCRVYEIFRRFCTASV